MRSQEPARFGERLRHYRLAAGLTQMELAERARLSQRAISDLERGVRTHPWPATVRQLADALGLDAEERARFEGMVVALRMQSAFQPSSLPVGSFLGALPSRPLVGRIHELHRVLHLAHAVESGSGRVVLVGGEPGIGKTRLAQEAMLLLRDRGFLVATGRCYPDCELIPYYSLLEALPQVYAGVSPPLRTEAPDRFPYLAHLLPDQMGPMAPDLAEDPQSQQRLLQAVTGFLQAVAEQVPLALLLDDLHVADSASLDLLLHLARHTRGVPLLLLGTYRDSELTSDQTLSGLLRELHHDQLVERIQLQRLDAAATGMLMAAMLGEEEVAEEFVRLIHAQTGGNAFFVREMLQALVERGDVVQEEGRWAQRAPGALTLPESVREAIGERVGRLPEEAQEVLREASVLGQTFHFDDLEAMSRRDKAVVEGALEAAVRLTLVQEMEDEVYGFTHMLIQHACYTALSGRRRHMLHQAAGAAIEQAVDAGGQRRAAEISAHFLKAGWKERALPYLIQAGDEAEALFAHREAQRHYRLAVELARELDDQGREVESLEKLGAVKLREGCGDDARDALERAAEIHRAMGNLDALGHVTAQIGLAYLVAGWTTSEAVQRLRSLLEALEQSEPSSILMEIHTRLATLAFLSGEYREQLAATERARRLAVQHDYPLSVESEFNRSLALGMLGQLDEAIDVCSATIPVAEDAGDLTNLAELTGVLGVWSLFVGSLAEAGRHLERSVQITEQIGNPWQFCVWNGALGLQRFIGGAWQEARYRLTLSLSAGEHSRMAYPLWQMGWLDLAEGRWAEAAELLDQSIAIGGRTGNLQVLRFASGLLAELDLVQGQPAAARERLLPLLDRLGLLELDVTFLLPRLAWAELEMGEVERATVLSADAVDRARRQRYHLVLADALRVQGSVLEASNKHDEASSALQEALDVCHSVSYPYAEARALYEWGLMENRQGNPAKAQERLQATLAIFRRLGARPSIERTEQALLLVTDGKARLA